MSVIHKGSCLCGEVRFEVDGEFESFFMCHCQYCRKDTGSAHASNLFSSSAVLTWISGENHIKTYSLPSTRHVKSFCSNCGSALPTVQMEGAFIAVPAGSMDTKVSNKPNAHIFVASKAEWDQDLDKVPMIEGLPG
ncbi:aldehyde-activating protein [Vibrio neptunius]|uniref:GFA family protein n=1 Tax=Vibrio neptunius TaxID=170651 RepID=UPI0005F9B7A3|nr:GFA family protein [Vibrio neptunius]KJY87579.1 aldehyde-activating protein [Vibrio neptunius]